jgi:thiamine biosynthesis protein ThiI
MQDSSGLIIIRPAGEVAIKSRRTRRKFEKILRANITQALRSVGAAADLRQDFGRLYLTTRNLDAVLRVLPRVFGIGTYSAVEAECPPTADDIVATGVKSFADRLNGMTYAVRAKKTIQLGFSTQSINEKLGAALNPFGTVNLSNPDITVYVEIGADNCTLFTDRRRGAGGLPIGVGGNGIALMSGGFDSPVAAWRIMKRGIALDYVLCNLGGGAYERMVLQVTKVLNDAWGFGHNSRLHVINFDGPVRDLKAKGRPEYSQVMLKRLMYRAASIIARETGAEAIVTGEALGQVSSQTLGNLQAIEPAATVPVLRPLIGFDKQEIIDAAGEIGTAAISKRVKEYCGIAPGRPVVASTRARLEHEDGKLDRTILDQAVAIRKIIDLNSVTSSDLREPYIYMDQIPGGAMVIDCQTPEHFLDWHVEGAKNQDPVALMDSLGRLDKGPVYVVYCAHGMHSAGVVEVMQQNGFEAYAFKGGLNAVKQYMTDRAV